VKRIVILGAGTAGTMMAAKLRLALEPDEWKVTLVDQDDVHVYQPGLLFIPFEIYGPRDLTQPRTRYVPSGVDFVMSEIDVIEPDQNRVRLMSGQELPYDFLIISTGSRMDLSETEGLDGEGWRKNVFDFYTLDGATALGERFKNWKGGRLVLNIVEMPIKCPVAPLEFVFLADWYFHEVGIRDKVEIVYATPLEGAFTKPRASRMLGGLLEEKNIVVEGEFAAGEVDSAKGVLSSWDGREVNFDLLITIPTHKGSEAIARSDMGDELDFVPTHRHTLQSQNWHNVFVIGDATDLPSSKAGSVAHFQGEVLQENVLRAINERDLLPAFDGHANCFIETGFGKAALIDFNYETEPLPGKFPLPGIGPFDLLGESQMNHWGKIAFRWMYWNVLIRGAEMPGIDAQMSMLGKWS
jgi:sulfide:quinone oxidoreductase